MMGGDFGSQAAAYMMLPLLIVAALVGAALFAAIFLGIPWLYEHVSIVVR